MPDVRIKMKTGAVSLTCELGYSYCYDTFGLQTRRYQRFAASAFNPIETYNQVVYHHAPPVFRYGDVFWHHLSHGGTALKRRRGGISLRHGNP